LLVLFLGSSSFLALSFSCHQQKGKTEPL